MRPQLPVLPTLALSGLLCVFSWNSNAATQVESEKAREELKLGAQAYNSGQYEQAAEHFRNAIRLDDHLAVAKIDLANTYGALWIPGVDSPDNNVVMKNAIDEYDSILASSPKNITALWAVASMYFGAHRFENAREYLKRLIQVEPDNAEAYYTAAVVDWAAAYKDMAKRRSKFNLKTPGYEKQPAGPQGLCEQVKVADGSTIDEGLKMTQAAMEKRDGYRDAMVYASLLYRLKAVAECNLQAYARDNAAAETFNEQASKTPNQPGLDQEKPLAENEVPSFFVFPPPPPPHTPPPPPPEIRK